MDDETQDALMQVVAGARSSSEAALSLAIGAKLPEGWKVRGVSMIVALDRPGGGAAISLNPDSLVTRPLTEEEINTRALLMRGLSECALELIAEDPDTCKCGHEVHSHAPGVTAVKRPCSVKDCPCNEYRPQGNEADAIQAS